MRGCKIGWSAPFVVSLAVLAACLIAGSSSAGTLVTANGPITAFAHDGGRIAWITGRCGAVRIRTLWSGREEVVGRTLRLRRNWEGDLMCLTGPPFSLGLGGKRAVWTAVLHETCSNTIGWVKTGALGDDQRVIATTWPCELASRKAAGDGDSLVFAHVLMEWSDICEEETCHTEFDVIGARVRRVEPDRYVPIQGTRPSVAIAVSRGRLAMVPAQAHLYVPHAYAAPNGPVEVRNVDTGALLSSFAPPGRVRAVAFSGSKVAVLVGDGAGNKRIEFHAAGTGALLATYPVSRGVAWELDLAGDRALYRVGRRIRLLNVSTGVRRLLTTTAARPIGLSIEGSRVAWAENVRGRGYVRAINVA